MNKRFSKKRAGRVLEAKKIQAPRGWYSGYTLTFAWSTDFRRVHIPFKYSTGKMFNGDELSLSISELDSFNDEPLLQWRAVDTFTSLQFIHLFDEWKSIPAIYLSNISIVYSISIMRQKTYIIIQLWEFWNLHRVFTQLEKKKKMYSVKLSLVVNKKEEIPLIAGRGVAYCSLFPRLTQKGKVSFSARASFFRVREKS